MWRIAAFAMPFLVVPAAWAQQLEAGRIDRIAESVRPGKWQSVDSTSKVQLLRLPSQEWRSAGRKGSVLLQDRMQVERLVDVQLQVAHPGQQGKLVFLTELLDKDLRPVVEDPKGRELKNALYEMRPSPDDSTLLAVSIEQGSLIIDWVHGRLLVVTPVTRFVIRGTKVAVTVYPGGEAAVVMVQAGVVTFPDSPDLQIQPGEVGEFQAGSAPRVSRPGPEDGARFRQAVQHNAKGIWSQLTPFWRKPAFLLPVAAVAAGAAAVVVGQSGGDGTRDGSVVINFP